MKNENKIEKRILVNCEEDEIKIAILEDNEVVELIIEREQAKKTIGNVYKGKISKVVNSLEAAFVDIALEKSVYLPFSELVSSKNTKRQSEIDIRKNDMIFVQITKEPISTKGARGTMHISLPGRILVYMPYEQHLGISKNIADKEERARLKDIMKELAKDIDGGFIIRTEGSGLSEDIFKREVEYLQKEWEQVQKEMKKGSIGKLVHKDLGVIFKVIRDKFSEQVASIVIDSKEEYNKAHSFINMINPDYVKKVEYYKSKTPIFKAYGVDKVLENIMKQKIYLKSGGYLIIQEAESLCAIDVNSGRTKGKSHEEIVLKTNIEAVNEVALQLRLRNIGGIIVIDFIDMDKREHRSQVLDALRNATQYDKAKIKILPITSLGLIEMTRERKAESVASYLSEKCPYCSGSGRVYSKESTFLKLKKALNDFKSKLIGRPVVLILNPAFKDFLVDEKMKKLEKSVQGKLNVQYDYRVNINDYEIRLR